MKRVVSAAVSVAADGRGLIRTPVMSEDEPVVRIVSSPVKVDIGVVVVVAVGVDSKNPPVLNRPKGSSSDDPRLR